jgi:FemAB-related protein (PEP-CTERM system-associated)
MEMNIQLYEKNACDRSDWDRYVAGHPAGTNYHLYGWRHVVERSFGHQACYLAARNSSNQICGILPLVHMKSLLFGSFLVSVPFFNYGGLLCDWNDVATVLLARCRTMLQETGAAHLELRHLSKFGGGLATKEHKVTMILHLENAEETQWKKLDAKVRNQVRKAEKSGLKAEVGHMELLDDFYSVFCRNMRDLGTPVYGKSFFHNILAEFPDSTRIICIKLGDHTVASGILTWFRDTLEVPWASSNRDYRELCPNNLLYWEAIKFSIRKGSARFDFGRSTPGEGTYRFKKQWGAEPVQLYWQYMLDGDAPVPELNPSNPKYRLAISMWQRLPVVLTRTVGPRIARCIP